MSPTPLLRLVLRGRPALCAIVALSLGAACDDGGGGDGQGGAADGGRDAQASGGMGQLLDSGPDATGGSAETDASGGATGGSGGVVSMEPSIAERCPDGQAGSYLLVLFPDRVDAYRPIGTDGYGYLCNVFDLRSNGITHATGFARGEDGNFYVVQPGEDFGEVFEFDPDGAFVRRAEANINLAGVEGIWNTFGDDFIVWNRANQNLYKLSSGGAFVGPYSPPEWQGNRVAAITDVFFVKQDFVVMTFSDRPAKLFAPPFAPDFVCDPERAESCLGEIGEIGGGNAVTGVATPEGVKLLMTAQIGGLDGGFGVVLYKPADTGRRAPDQESLLLPAAEIIDGIDVLATEAGFIVMDSAIGGAPRIGLYNHDSPALLLNDIPVYVPEGGSNNPVRFMIERIFPSL